MQRSIRFPPDLAERIRVIAEQEDRSFSYVVVRAMEKALATDAAPGEDGRVSPDRVPAPSRPSEPDFTPEDYEAAQLTGRFMGEDEVKAKAQVLDAEIRSKPAKPERISTGRRVMSDAMKRQQGLNAKKGL